MGLEAVTYISDYNSSNPVATDQVSEGDDHIRRVKLGVLNTFPNITGAMTATHTELNYLDGVTGTTGTGKLVLDTAPTLGAITATSYDGIAAANLVDKSAAESISGTWTFTNLVGGVLTATSYGGITEANLVDKSAAETVSGAWTFTGAVNIGSASTTLSEGAAGKLEVEGKPVIAHNDGTLGSGEIYVSTSAPSGGSDGDIWLEREA